MRPRGTLGLMFAADRVQDLLRRLREDVAALIHSEIELAKTEVIEKVKMHAKAAVLDRHRDPVRAAGAARVPVRRDRRARPRRCPLWAAALIVGGVLVLVARSSRCSACAPAQGGHADARRGDRRGQGDRRRPQEEKRTSRDAARPNASAPRRQAARERLVGTVNELGTAVQDAKRRARERAQAAAPYVVGGVGLITVLKVLRRKR